MFEIVPVIFKAVAYDTDNDTGLITLPINFGTLGGDVINVQQIAAADGTPTVVNRTSYFHDRVQHGDKLQQQAGGINGTVYLALIRTPGTQYQN